MKFKFTRGRIILLVVIVILAIIARPVGFLLYNYFTDNKLTRTERKGYSNDASNLNETKVAEVIRAHSSEDSAIVQIISLVKQAGSEGKKISIAGAQHSMGGHTIYPDGIMLDMKGFHTLVLDSIENILTAGSGTLWAEIIPYLDSNGRSVAIMQSNNSFSVGGSISVNCHGWQPNSPPIASSVKSFRLIKADGEVVTCSRTENSELFSLVLGGYGLFGVILDVKLKVVKNQMYRAMQFLIPADDYVSSFNKYVRNNPNAGLVYGRININPDNFMEEAILSIFSIDDKLETERLKKNSFAQIRRTVFRASAGSGYGKNLRWNAEKIMSRKITGRKFSRNQLLNEGVELFQNTDTAYTDILHEYFLPGKNVVAFIHELKKTIPAFKVDLLNITIRNVEKDNDTFLPYAREAVFGFVLLFNQKRDPAAEEEMKKLTQELIDISASLDGTYYLPYRLHATKEQFYKTYPQAVEFFIKKKQHDPGEIFRNKFYEAYK